MNVDMSPKAITERLRLVSQLTALCLALGKARPIKRAPVVPRSPRP
jgi:hypothetical protein